ncbi:MAG: hypothetical protein OHK0013_26530 [Sandaracinaceae bacterium]
MAARVDCEERAAGRAARATEVLGVGTTRGGAADGTASAAPAAEAALASLVEETALVADWAVLALAVALAVLALGVSADDARALRAAALARGERA